MEALHTTTVRVAAIIAEGVPEKDTKKLIAYARANNKVLIGPATVGGVQVCALTPFIFLPWYFFQVLFPPGRHHCTLYNQWPAVQSAASSALALVPLHAAGGRGPQAAEHCSAHTGANPIHHSPIHIRIRPSGGLEWCHTH
jgi:hypothetical protein